VTITIDAPVGAIHELPLQIEIFDLAGRRVAELPSPSVPLPLNGRRIETLRPSGTSGTGHSSLEKGGMEVPLLKGDLGGSYIWQPAAALSSGVYLARARFGGCVVTRRLVYLK